jgi:hypothetical protein
MLLVPFATPLAAMPTTMELSASHAEGGPPHMPEGMPCCPDTQKAPDCAKDCPFLAVCSGSYFPPLTSATPIGLSMTLLAIVAPVDDAKLSGLAQGPPAKPPKS